MTGCTKMSGSRITRIVIDHDLCVGSTMCLGVDPARFDLDDKAQAIFVGTDIDETLAREAAEVCPVAAIKLVFEE